jgi:solute:Na+ symporter, SSS family
VHPIDYGIVVVYLAVIVVAGVWLARRARQSSEHYFLGGRRLRWWALGSSGMASNLDVAGTMTIVTMVTLYGIHGLFIEMRGGVVLPIAVFLAFMGKWHRRSEVMTTAEWMLLRFGDGPGGRAARTTAAVTYVILTIAMIVFFLKAGGTFLAEFLPFTATQCALGMAAVAFGYTLVGGLYGVIWTDVFQTFLIGGAAIYVAVVAAQQVSPELLAAWPGAALNDFLPRLADPALAPYHPFWAFLAVWAGKGVLEGLGGSGGSAYMAQRFYAAASEADCRRIGLLWTVLFAVRWPMVLGFALLAIQLGMEVRTLDEAEAVLPRVLHSDFFPAGVRGLVIAAMLAAAMSTFDSTINAGASYVVRDLWQPWRARAGARELVWAGYAASALLVGLGVGIALALTASIVTVWIGIVMLLFPAFLVPFALRWYWARYNGAGFAVGTAGGFAAALYFALARPDGWNEATQFLAIAAASAMAAVVATCLSPPVAEAQQRRFYQRVRPFGTWPRAWRQPDRAEHRLDVRVLLAALVWQVLTFLIPMGAVLQKWGSVVPAGVIWSVLLWYLLRAGRPAGERGDSERVGAEAESARPTEIR